VSPPPAQPKIYHITHVDNLASIIADDGLVSDAAMIARGDPTFRNAHVQGEKGSSGSVWFGNCSRLPGTHPSG